MQNFEFQVNFSQSEELSIGLEHRLKSVVEIPLDEVQQFASIANELPVKIFSSLNLAEKKNDNSTSQIEDILEENGLTFSEETGSFLSETIDGEFITYFMRRLKSDSPEIIGTHRMNFKGDIRKIKDINPLSEVATITNLSKEPHITWLLKEPNSDLKKFTTKLIEKKVYEIPFKDIPSDLESLIWVASGGSKSHGH